MDPKVRFAKHYVPEPNSGCWLWIGAHSTATGYGNFRISPKANAEPAHRASWRLHCGSIPGGMQICHRCDVPACVNPDHLFVGTPTDNMRDAAQKGRMNWKPNEVRALKRGIEHPAAKLTEADVLAIRASARLGIELAEAYGVSNVTISRIQRRLLWRHVP
jgi:hypothetical protein